MSMIVVDSKDVHALDCHSRTWCCVHASIVHASIGACHSRAGGLELLVHATRHTPVARCFSTSLCRRDHPMTPLYASMCHSIVCQMNTILCPAQHHVHTTEGSDQRRSGIRVETYA